MKLSHIFISAVACSLSAIAMAASKQPNIIVVLVDDLGWGDLNIKAIKKADDTPRIHTPQLAKMASTGLVLRRHYTAAPVCAPARASLFGGMHQGCTEVIRNNNFDAALENSHTLASVLKHAGYTTALIGKWGIGGGNENGGTPESSAAWPTKRGFDFFFGMHNHIVGHRHYAKEERSSDPDTQCNAIWENGKVITQDLDTCYTTDLFTARAKKWIIDTRKSAPNQPFFLALTLTAPHARLGIPSVEYPAGGGLNGGVQWIGKPGHMINTATGEWDTYINKEYRNNPVWKQYAQKRFGQHAQNAIATAQRHASMVTRIDDAVGDLMTLCYDLGIEKNTFILFTSDNGPHNECGAVGGFAGHPAPAQNPAFFRSYGPFNGIKRDVWDGGLRVPSLIWGPGIVKQGVSDFPCQFHDWMATFANMAGVPAPMRTTGISLLPMLQGNEGAQPFGTIYGEYNFGGGMAYYDDYADNKKNRPRGEQQTFYFRHADGRFLKAIRTGIKTGYEDFEIFDTVKDPAETQNLAGDMPPGTQDMLRTAVLHNRRAFGYRHDNTAGRRHNGISGARCYDSILIPANAVENAQPGILMRQINATCAYVPKFDTISGAEQASTSVVAAPTAVELPAGSITEFKGYINVPSDDHHWHFFLTLNNTPGSKAYIRMHRFPLVDADANYTPGTTAQTTTTPNAEEMSAEEHAKQAARGIPLKAGLHEITITAVQGNAAPGKLKLEWSRGKGNTDKQLIPDAAFKY